MSGGDPPVRADTSAYSQLKRGQQDVLARLREYPEVLVPTVVIGELVAGFHQGTSPREHEAALDAFLAEAPVRVIDIDKPVAVRFGEVLAELRKRGRPLPTNDVWIAAVCLNRDAELLTFDGDFEMVPGLCLVRFRQQR
ncbi:MAG: type II toxin-antitoxin system VapC family toxin [Myxococcaceae bacterium]|nr:type II toxin-antitoxin system VapC family toxin [Myxococcaceae bacterium]